MIEIILKENQELEEYNGYNVVLTFANGKRLLTNEEQEEIVTQTFDGIYAGSVSPDVKWKARV